jgi:hypothetical protein
MRYLLPLTVFIAALLPLPALSQTEAAGQLLRVGERISVTTTTLRDLDGRRVDSTRISVMVGTVVAVGPDGLVVADSTGRELMVPTQNATRLQVYGGTTVSPVPPLLGVLAGAALGDSSERLRARTTAPTSPSHNDASISTSSSDVLDIRP